MENDHDCNTSIQEQEEEEKSFEHYSKNANAIIKTVKNTFSPMDDTRTLEDTLAL